MENAAAPAGGFDIAIRPPHVAPEQVQFVYRPMWQVRRRVLSACICVPVQFGSDGTLRFGGAAMPLTKASPENAALDILTMRKVFEDLKRLEKDERKTILVAPVHYFTINDPDSATTFSELCSSLAEDLRNLLVFELIGVPNGVPSTALANALSRLKPFSRAVLMRQRLDSKDFSRLNGMGLFGVGADVGNHPLSEEDIFRDMDQFNRRAKLFSLSTYIHGVRSLSLISAAAGRDSVSSTATRSCPSSIRRRASLHSTSKAFTAPCSPRIHDQRTAEANARSDQNRAFAHPTNMCG